MSAIFYSRYDQVLDFMYYFVGTAAGVANLFHDVYAGSKVGEVITVFHQYTAYIFSFNISNMKFLYFDITLSSHIKYCRTYIIFI